MCSLAHAIELKFDKIKLHHIKHSGISILHYLFLEIHKFVTFYVLKFPDSSHTSLRYLD